MIKGHSEQIDAESGPHRGKFMEHSRSYCSKVHNCVIWSARSKVQIVGTIYCEPSRETTVDLFYSIAIFNSRDETTKRSALNIKSDGYEYRGRRLWSELNIHGCSGLYKRRGFSDNQLYLGNYRNSDGILIRMILQGLVLAMRRCLLEKQFRL